MGGDADMQRAEHRAGRSPRGSSSSLPAMAHGERIDGVRRGHDEQRIGDGRGHGERRACEEEYDARARKNTTHACEERGRMARGARR